MPLPDIRAEVQRHRNLKAELLALYPELTEEDPALADTLMGETTLDRVIAAMIEEALIREALADGIAGRIKAMHERKSRLTAGADRLRAMALWAMQELGGDQKLVEPTFTASVGKAPAAVIVTNEDAIPDRLCRIVREPSKTAIAIELKAGRDVPGCVLGNARAVLRILTS
jgi:Gp157 protein